MLKRKNKRVRTDLPSAEGIIEFIDIDAKANGIGIHLRPERITLPQWYKDLPVIDTLFPNAQPDLTAKRCIPILDAMTMGYHLVTTVDYEFKKSEKTGEYHFTGPAEMIKDKPISMHSLAQLSTLTMTDDYIPYAFKWANTWTIKTPPGYSILFTNPLNQRDLPFHIFDGVVDTDKFFMPVLFPFLMKSGFEGVIPAGTPVVQVIPFKRDDWKMVVTTETNDSMMVNYQQERNLYESGRYDKEGKPLGGMYKRDYRSKKKYS